MGEQITLFDEAPPSKRKRRAKTKAKRSKRKSKAKPRRKKTKKRKPKVEDEGRPIDWHRLTDTTVSLAEARAWLRQHVLEGAICPCCELPAKIYKRKLNSSMAYVLILMTREYALNGGSYMHVPSMLNRKGLKPKVAASLRGDYAKLRYWGLIEEDKQPKKRHGEDKGKKTNGYWRPTPDGLAFARGETRVASHAIIYGGTCIELTEDSRVSIQAALGDRWDYVELMTEVA